MPGKLVRVARITAPHGIRGEVKLESFTEVPTDVLSLCPLTDAGQKRAFSLKLAGKTNKNQLIVRISEVSDRNAAELLKGVELFASSDAFQESSDDEGYYGHELEGLEVRDSEGTTLGKVLALHNFGAGDILEIEYADGGTEMFPFTEEVFPECEPAKGYMTLQKPETL